MRLFAARHFAQATVAQNFQAEEVESLDLSSEAAGPKPEYLEYHRNKVFNAQ